MEESSKTLLSELKKTDNPKIVLGALEDIFNAEESGFREVCNGIDFSLFTIRNLKNKDIIDKMIKIITRKDIVYQRAVIKLLANNCGGCFLCLLFIIISEYNCYEKELYSFIITYINDDKGIILEPKAFMQCCEKIASSYQSNSKETELCKQIEKGIWGDYIQGLGVLINNDLFIQKVKEDAKAINNQIEAYITQKDGFDAQKANDFLRKL